MTFHCAKLSSHIKDVRTIVTPALLIAPLYSAKVYLIQRVLGLMFIMQNSCYLSLFLIFARIYKLLLIPVTQILCTFCFF
jgi:hypothetical protein